MVRRDEQDGNVAGEAMKPDPELRREVWEALRRRFEYEDQRWKEVPLDMTNRRPIDLDDGIALAELRKLCKEYNYSWRIEETAIGITCSIYRRGMTVRAGDLTVAYAKGETPARAICKAIVEAARKVKS